MYVVNITHSINIHEMKPGQVTFKGESLLSFNSGAQKYWIGRQWLSPQSKPIDESRWDPNFFLVKFWSS